MSIGKSFLIRNWDKATEIIYVKNYDYYIFDLDGTLYPYEFHHNKALGIVLNEFAISEGISTIETESLYDEAKEVVKGRLGNTALSHSRKLYFLEMLIASTGYNVEKALTYENIYWSNFISTIEIFSGVIRFLESLKKCEKKVIILSDMTLDIQLKKLDKLGIKSYFNYIVTSDIIGSEKPSINGYEFIAKLTGLSKARTLMIGDNLERDYEGAKNYGIDYAHVQN